MMESKPSLIIIAGSNGSGKSTLTRRTFKVSNGSTGDKHT